MSARSVHVFMLALLTVILAAAGAPVSANPEGITPAVMSIADCPSQPGCPAIILLDEYELNNESSRTRYSVRRVLKIFSSEGVDEYGTVDAPIEVSGFDVRDFEGKTYLPDGREVKLKEKDIQTKKLRRGDRFIKTKTATFPGVVPGAVIEYSYKVHTKPNSYMTEALWDIQQELPILKSTYVLKQGEYRLGWRHAGNKDIEVAHSKPHKHVDRFDVQNVPPIPDEPYGPPPSALQARYYFELPELLDRWLSSYAGQIAGFAGYFTYGGEEFNQEALKVFAADDPPRTRLRKIYRFVQEEIGPPEQREGADENLDQAKNVSDVMARGYGNALERTMLFLALSRAASLDARLLLIVSRDHSVLDENAYDQSQFDSVAVAVKSSSGWTFYDPGVRYCPYGMLYPQKESGEKNALLLEPMRGAGAEIDVVVQNLRVKTYEPTAFMVAGIPFSPARKNVRRREARVVVSPDGTAQVSVTEKGKGQVDFEQKRLYADLDDSARRERLGRRVTRIDPQAELISAEFESIESFDETATVSYELSLPGWATVAGDRIIATPSVFAATRPNPFTSENRTTPVHFSYSTRIQDTVRVEIPDGYVVDSLPEPVAIRDKPLVMTMTFSKEPGAVKMSRRFEIDAAVWPPGDYERLRVFFEKAQEADQQVLTFTKDPGPSAGGEQEGQ